eukprot:Hpha_TRINITY_DN16333_c0_g4::TRINITY_DN16333_c0_g4_i1::g.62000::m.62000
MSGAMFLCWGCQHTFPESIVDKVDLPEGLETHFNSVQGRLCLLRDMKNSIGGERAQRVIAELETDFRRLVLAVQKESRALKEERQLIAIERRDLEDRLGKVLQAWGDVPEVAGMGYTGQRMPNPPASRVTTPAAPQRNASVPEPPVSNADASTTAASPQVGSNSTTTGGGVLRHRLFTSRGGLPEDRRAVANRFQKEVHSARGTYGRDVTGRPAHGVATAASQVLAALFMCMESLVANCSAAAGRLWCRAAGAGVISSEGDELTCFITVGTGDLGGEPAVRVGINQGTVGVVCSTGVALNVGVAEGKATVSDRVEGRKALPGEAGDDEMNADEAMGCHSLLCFPIPARFRAFGRRGEDEG